MKRLSFIFTLICLVSLTSSVMAQDQKRQIQVTGFAERLVKPDHAKVSIRLTEVDKNYNKAIEALNEKTERVRKELIQAGFKSDDLKTMDFNVRKDYEYTGGRERKFKGYQASHLLIMLLPADNTKLNKIMGAITESLSEADFDVTYYIKDEGPVYEGLIQEAVKDASKKAKLLANAAGVQIGKVSSIQYGETPHPYNPMQFRMSVGDMAMEKVSADGTFNNVAPAEIKLQSRVIMTYDIK